MKKQSLLSILLSFCLLAAAFPGGLFPGSLFSGDPFPGSLSFAREQGGSGSGGQNTDQTADQTVDHAVGENGEMTGAGNPYEPLLAEIYQGIFYDGLSMSQLHDGFDESQIEASPIGDVAKTYFTCKFLDMGHLGQEGIGLTGTVYALMDLNGDGQDELLLSSEEGNLDCIYSGGEDPYLIYQFTYRDGARMVGSYICREGNWGDGKYITEYVTLGGDDSFVPEVSLYEDFFYSTETTYWQGEPYSEDNPPVQITEAEFQAIKAPYEALPEPQWHRLADEKDNLAKYGVMVDAGSYKVRIPEDIANRYVWQTNSLEGSEYIYFYDRAAYEAGESYDSYHRFTLDYSSYQSDWMEIQSSRKEVLYSVFSPWNDRKGAFVVVYSEAGQADMEQTFQDAATLIYSLQWEEGYSTLVGGDSKWSRSYRDFVRGHVFLSDRSDINYDTGNWDYENILASAYDIDRDGVPELILTNGKDGEERCTYVYTYEAGQVQYIGQGPDDYFVSDDWERPGLFGHDNAYPVRTTSYFGVEYAMGHFLSLTRTPVYTYDDSQGEAVIKQVTEDFALYESALGWLEEIPWTSVADLTEGDWDAFIQGCGYSSDVLGLKASDLPLTAPLTIPLEDGTQSDSLTTVTLRKGLFDQSTIGYHASIAKLAILLSTAAYSGLEEHNNFKGNGYYIVQAYHDLGFKDENISLYGYPGNSLNRTLPNFDTSVDTMAFSIAYRPMGDYLLMTVVLRGTRKLLDLSDPDTQADLNADSVPFFGLRAHEGFNEYREKVDEGFLDFLKTHPEVKEAMEEDKVKLLVTGHSMGAAGANLFGAGLSSLTYDIEWDSFVNSFIYTFACPRTFNILDGKETTLGSCGNIFNIVSDLDLVPGVPFEVRDGYDWDIWRRFGRRVSYNTTKGLNAIAAHEPINYITFVTNWSNSGISEDTMNGVYYSQ